jgi:hypothetical protein
VGGEVLAIPHAEGVVYVDALARKELQPALKDGRAVFSLDMRPRDVACIVAKKR